MWQVDVVEGNSSQGDSLWEDAVLDGAECLQVLGERVELIPEQP